MSAALGDRECRVLAHAWHLHKDQDRKKYKLMNEFCVHHGLLDRSPDQYKYVLQKKQVVIDACNAKDKWDEDVENAISKEMRISLLLQSRLRQLYLLSLVCLLTMPAISSTTKGLENSWGIITSGFAP